MWPRMHFLDLQQQKHVPRIAVTTPMRHDRVYTAMVPNLASPRLLIVQRQRTRDMAYWSYIAYLDIRVSWGTYLAGRDGSQVASIHYNTVPANDRISSEPSLHCVMMVSNLPHFVATKLYRLGLQTSTVLQSKCHIWGIEQLVQPLKRFLLDFIKQ